MSQFATTGSGPLHEVLRILAIYAEQNLDDSRPVTFQIDGGTTGPIKIVVSG